jgi:tetratricopeptide (TPR) repeat protein
VWAESYDRELKDIFAVQDEVRQKIVLALKVKLTPEEHERFRRAPTDNLEAYDYYLRGAEYYRRFTKERNAQARQMFEKATELDPQYAAAYADLGRTYSQEWAWQWSQDPQILERAFALAQQAIALDDSLPVAHRILGGVYLWKKQHDLAAAEGERAIALDPNDADNYWTLSLTLNFAGRPEEAIRLAEQAMRLNPHDPILSLNSLGWAYLLMGRYEDAIAALKKALPLNLDFLPNHYFLAVSYSELDRQEEARTEVAAVLRISPNFSVEALRQRLPYKDPIVLERIAAALRKAGLK